MTKQSPPDNGQIKVDPWFSAEELKKESLKYEKMDPALILSDNDFSSYAKVSRGNGIKGSSIEKHNLINCDSRARLYFELLGRKRFSNIADIGCGIGLITIALSKIFNADKVAGFDISQDAINFAKQNSSQREEYFVKKVEPNTPLGGSYELVVAQEFYPFTRTKDLRIHMGYIESLMLSLSSPKGVLLIGLSNGTSESILNNIEEIAIKVQEMGANLSMHYLPHEKLFNITRIYWLSKIMTRFVNLLIKKTNL
uniref:methyltransferase domain-containing protein n=1 Tax=Polynucleobacter sp. TaxID=2029855 RepID=UPI004047863D